MPRRKGDDLDDFIVPDDEVEESEDSEVESLCEKESSSEEDEAPRRRRAPLSRRAVEDSSSSSEDDSDDDGIPAGYLYCALCAKPVVADSFSAKQKKLYNSGEEAYCLLHSQGDHRLYVEQLELTAARNNDGTTNVKWRRASSAASAPTKRRSATSSRASGIRVRGRKNARRSSSI